MCKLSHNPLKDIIGSLGKELLNKKIALCVTGSVAAIETSEIARELMRRGAEVYPVLSKSACELIGPKLMEWATGNKSITELTGNTEHIQLAGEWVGKVDVVIIAPATANTIGKIAAGIDDTTVTTVATTALGSGIPIFIAPAMHYSMFRHSIVMDNINKLKKLGIQILEPEIIEGKAKMAPTSMIVEAVIRKFYRRDLKGVKFLVSAGPTIEYLDPVRIITNKSSGKMGIAVALEASRRGADSTLVTGVIQEKIPQGMRTLRTETSKEMLRAVKKELARTKYDVFVGCAAVSDFRPSNSHKTKIPTRDNKKVTIELEVTSKIVNAIKKLSSKTSLIVFKAEYGLSDSTLIEKARQVMRSSRADLVVANHVGIEGAGFGSDTNEAYIIDRNGKTTRIPRMTKQDLAREILDYMINFMGLKGR
ncbi:bifunctional phosphopantothenoylcysteine decarboxylase/phosphopantothenate--cysteine ligase CoaBC [[Eubacterium] cellulosolvens]